jgi:AcrR family transcriptional regulator
MKWLQAESSVGTFYAYFRSKQQLLLVLMQRYLETMLALDLLTIDDTQLLLAIISQGVHRAFVPDASISSLRHKGAMRSSLIMT